METPTKINYPSQFDPAVFRRQAKRGLRRGWLRIVAAGLLAGLVAGVLFLLFYAIWWTTSPALGVNMGLLATLLFTTLMGIPCLWSHLTNVIETVVKANINDADGFQCRLDDFAFETERPNGIVLRIPWKLIKVDMETDEAITVSYGKEESLIVFRKPLRDGGAEAFFFQRLAAVQSESHGSPP